MTLRMLGVAVILHYLNLKGSVLPESRCPKLKLNIYNIV